MSWECFDVIKFSHTLIVVQQGRDVNDTLIAAHTYDTFGKSVAEYGYSKYRCIHVEWSEGRFCSATIRSFYASDEIIGIWKDRKD